LAVDETHTLSRAVTLTSANGHESPEFETGVRGDEELVIADKACWSRSRSAWCGRQGVAHEILRKPSRGEKLKDAAARLNRRFSSIRCKIEKVFGWWKRSAGYRRVRYVGWEANRLDLEFKRVCWNLKRLVTLSVACPPAPSARRRAKPTGHAVPKRPGFPQRRAGHFHVETCR
jgi:IS5 family transposase